MGKHCLRDQQGEPTMPSHKPPYFSYDEAQYEIGVQCLNYLSSDWFSEKLQEDSRRKYAINGYYVLQDYATSKWMDHFASLVDLIKPKDCGGRCYFLQSNCLDEFQTVLDKFVTRYNTTLMQIEYKIENEKKKGEKNKLRALEDCKEFRQFQFSKDFIENLEKVWTHVRIHEGASWEMRNKISIAELKKELDTNRHLLIQLYNEHKEICDPKNNSQDLMKSMKFVSLYGNKFYKCDRVVCNFFWEGFVTERHVSEHMNRHQRPFNCKADGCTIAKFGFQSNKDRTRHIRIYHPDDPEAGPSPFPTSQKPKSEAKFQCQHCSKKFTRNINLKSHMLSHFGERPYSCGTCGKSFARVNDQRRHEKIHQRSRIQR